MLIKNLRPLREARGMTQEALARKAGNSQEAVSQHERQVRGARIETVRAYAKALGLRGRWYLLVED